MQKAIIVRDNDTGTNILNDYLDEGWKVVNTCAMPSSSFSNGASVYKKIPPTCLVTIEQD